MRKQVVALEGSVFGEYLLGRWREAWRKTVILKKFGSTYQALTKGPVLDGVLPGPAVSPKACAELVAIGAIVIIHKKNKASSLISGSRRTLSVICWLGEGLKCVKTSGNGRKGSAWAPAVHFVMDINFHLNVGFPEILTSEKAPLIIKGDCGISVGLLAGENLSPNCLLQTTQNSSKGNGVLDI